MLTCACGNSATFDPHPALTGPAAEMFTARRAGWRNSPWGPKCPTCTRKIMRHATEEVTRVSMAREAHNAQKRDKRRQARVERAMAG